MCRCSLKDFRSDDRGVTWTNVLSANAALNTAITSAANNNTEMAVVERPAVCRRAPERAGAVHRLHEQPGRHWTAMDLPLTPDAGGGSGRRFESPS